MVSLSLSPQQRRLRAQLAAHTMHAKHDARAFGQRAQAAILAKLEQEVDPDGVLPVAERQRRARQLRKAWLTRLAYDRAQRDRAARDQAAAAEAAAELQQLADAADDEGGR